MTARAPKYASAPWLSMSTPPTIGPMTAAAPLSISKALLAATISEVSRRSFTCETPSE